MVSGNNIQHIDIVGNSLVVIDCRGNSQSITVEFEKTDC